jgi:N-acetylglucosamine malate deacetylase 1
MVAAAHLGAEFRFLNFVEGAIVDDPQHTHRIMDMIRECRPDIVLTHQPTDYHPDHRALSRAVLAACLLARVGEIKSQHPVHKVGNLFYTETTSDVNSQATIYIDVAKTWQQKIEALKLYAQLSKQRGVAHLDSIEHLIEREETSMKFRGFRVERDYCEAFQVAMNYRVRWVHDLLPTATLPPLEE